jgi:hypothetical protein
LHYLTRSFTHSVKTDSNRYPKQLFQLFIKNVTICFLSNKITFN